MSAFLKQAFIPYYKGKNIYYHTLLFSLCNDKLKTIGMVDWGKMKWIRLREDSLGNIFMKWFFPMKYVQHNKYIFQQ